MLNRLGLGQCRAEPARANVKSLPGAADVEPNGPGHMSSGAGLGLCRVDWALTNVEPSGPGPMSSCAKCRVVWAQVIV